VFREEVMKGLSLSTFISMDADFELNQYKVLGGLKEYLHEFNKKRLYPAFSDLVALVNQLKDIRNQKYSLEVSFPKQIKEYDLKNKKIIYDKIEEVTQHVEFLFDLIDWALPKIKDAIEEGVTIHEYVEENLRIENVGILPLHKSEGYFLVPDNKEAILQIHRFECSLFSSESDQYRALKTKYVRAVKKGQISESPETIKLDLIHEFIDLPNPATFICETDLDFPFSATIFPIAKRKLMAQLAAA
jgi:hypothetical protein